MPINRRMRISCWMLITVNKFGSDLPLGMSWWKNN